MRALKRPGTVLTDVVPLICVVLGMSQELLLQSEEPTAGGMGTHILLLQQVLVLDVMLK